MLSENVAAELRAHMARHKINQSTLTDRINAGGRIPPVNAAWVFRRIRGYTPLDIDDLDVIAAALDVDLAELVRAARSAGSRLVAV
jgi:hypothetical protein